MNNLIPYISSEPPPINNDSFELESYNPGIFNQYNINDNLSNNDVMGGEMDVDQIEPSNACYQYHNFGRNNDLLGSRNPVELFQYIENVIDENNLRVDVTDSCVNDDKNDNISEHSFDGQFDDYIDSVTEYQPNIANDAPVIPNKPIVAPDNVSHTISRSCSDNRLDASQSPQNDDLSGELATVTAQLHIDDFGDFPPIDANYHSTNVFKENGDGSLDSEALPEDFADFSFVNYSQEDKDANIDREQMTINEKSADIDADDDFEDFATFEDCCAVSSPDHLVVQEKDVLDSDTLLKSLLENIWVNFGSCQSDLIHSQNLTELSRNMRSDSFISNQKLFDDIGLVVWKELTNYDYSPAFIFQWMQSATYERFMTSIGPEYKEMLSSHRATLPLYSVNLTPIEPILLDNYLQFNVRASSSSSIDLVSKDDAGGMGIPERNSNIDFKNLEEEFIFDKFSSTPEVIKFSDGAATTNSSSSPIPNVSSTVIQSDRFGGILKSILKPLNSSKTSLPIGKSMNPEAEAVLKELPDLSYMSSKVLMFPVISACDVEDNI